MTSHKDSHYLSILRRLDTLAAIIVLQSVSYRTSWSYSRSGLLNGENSAIEDAL